MKDMRHSPVAMFQIRAVWSMDAVATCNALGTSSNAIWTSSTIMYSYHLFASMHLVKRFTMETSLAAACKANGSSHNLPSKLGSISIVWVHWNAFGSTPAWSVLWARFLKRSKLPDATTSCAQEGLKIDWNLSMASEILFTFTCRPAELSNFHQLLQPCGHRQVLKTFNKLWYANQLKALPIEPDSKRDSPCCKQFFGKVSSLDLKLSCCSQSNVYSLIWICHFVTEKNHSCKFFSVTPPVG